MHLFGKWHARRWIIYPRRRKFINSKLHVCHIWTWDKKRHSKIKLISVCLTNFMKKLQQVWGKQLNKTVPVLLLFSCSTRTVSHSFSEFWVLLSIASFADMHVLVICIFIEGKSCCRYREYLRILHFMSSHELANQNFY